MGVHEGQGQLSRATKDLIRHWRELKNVWTDANADRLEESLIVPIDAEVRNASAAMADAAMKVGRSISVERRLRAKSHMVMTSRAAKWGSVI